MQDGTAPHRVELMDTRRLWRMIGTAALVAALAVFLALVSGEVTLVTTHGVSMLPLFHTGDLGVVVRAGSYHVGEIVAYRSPVIRGLVLHRIVAEHGGRFTFKGDNNDFLDPVRLPPSTVVGHLWFRIPDGGYVLAYVRSRIGLGSIVLAVVLVVAIAGEARRRPAHAVRHLRTDGTWSELPWERLRHRVTSGRRGVHVRVGGGEHRPSVDGPGHSFTRSPITGGDGGGPAWRRRAHVGDELPVSWWPVAVPAAAAALVAALAGAWWSAPLTKPTPSQVGYSQHISFSYTASAPPGVTYPSGSVTTGQPVFLQLVHVLDVGVQVHVAPKSPGSRLAVHGTIGATAALQGPGGWTATLATVGPLSFNGTGAAVQLPVDLTQIPALTKAFTTQTDIPFGATSVVVTPTVTVRGSLDGVPLAASADPSLQMPVEGQQLELVPAPGSTGTTPSFPQLQSVRSGSVARPIRVANHVSLLGRGMTVAWARRLSVVLVLLVLASAVGGLLWVRSRLRMDTMARIRATYGRDLVPIGASPTDEGLVAFDVDSMAALARLAESADSVILEHRRPGGCSYFVEAGGLLYRFATADGSPARDALIWEQLHRVGVATAEDAPARVPA